MRYGNRNFLPWLLSYPGLSPLGFLQTTQLISLVVFYLANFKRRQLPPLACYWLRPCFYVKPRDPNFGRLVTVHSRYRQQTIYLDNSRTLHWNCNVRLKSSYLFVNYGAFKTLTCTQEMALDYCYKIIFIQWQQKQNFQDWAYFDDVHAAVQITAV